MILLSLLLGATLSATDAPFTLSPGLLLQEGETTPVEGEETLDGFKWGGHITAGLTVLAGNSRSTQASLDAEAVGERESDRITLRAGWLAARQTDTATRVNTTVARRLSGFAKYDHFYSEHLYSFALAQAKKDGVADLNSLWNVSVGGGYQWIREEDEHLSTEAGVGFTKENYGDNTSDADYMSARLALHYDVAISETSEFYHDSEWIPSLKDFQDDQTIHSVTGLRARIRDDLFGEAKVVWDWDSSPARGFKRQDVTYIFGLTWTF